MKSMLILGGDHIDMIAKKLEGEGFKKVIHVNGRKKRMIQTAIPRNVDLILVLTDCIGHNLTSVMKRKAQEKGIPICFSKQSWCSISKKIHHETIK